MPLHRRKGGWKWPSKGGCCRHFSQAARDLLGAVKPRKKLKLTASWEGKTGGEKKNQIKGGKTIVWLEGKKKEKNGGFVAGNNGEKAKVS